MLCQDCRVKFTTNQAHNKHLCTQCGTCSHFVCQCRKRTGAVAVPKSRAAGIGNSSIFIKSQRAIGIELELSNWGSWHIAENRIGFLQYNGSTYRYTGAHDGSVQPSALEAVFDPLAGDQRIIGGLNAIADKIYTSDAEVNASCGYHVHVNAQDFGWLDIQKLLTLWFGMEQGGAIFTVAGRGPNRFCNTWTNWCQTKNLETNLPSYNLTEFKSFAMAALYGVNANLINYELRSVYDTSRFRNTLKEYYKQRKILGGDRALNKPHLNEWSPSLRLYQELVNKRGWNRTVPSRYLNLNIHSWKFRGTVEYRLGNGTVNPNDIRMWPLFCLWFTEAVSRTSYPIIKKYYTRRKEDPLMQFIADGGIRVPSMAGEKLYEIPPFLLTWLKEKLLFFKKKA